MKKISFIIIMLMACMISGCSKANASKLGYETYKETYQLTDEYSFEYIQVRGMEDQELQEKINSSLTGELFDYIEWGHIEYYHYTTFEPVIHLQSEKYLSVENMFKQIENGRSMSTEWVCITVDMETGEIVYLDDLIQLDEEFAEFIKEQKLIKRDSWLSWTDEEMTEMVNDLYSRMTEREILELFQAFSTEELYKIWLQNDNWRTYYYLEEGTLVYNHMDGLVRTWIDIDDISDFLKVEPW